MGKLLERMKDASRSGVYRVSEDRGVLDVVGQSGLDVVSVSFEGASGKDALLKKLADALGFPKWFGGNWDALEDCLSDLSWSEAQGWVLVFREHDRLARDDLGVLADVLASAAEYWAERGRLFFAVFVDPRHALALPDLYREKSGES